LRARQTEIGFVGVDDPALVVDDGQALTGGVGHELGDIVAGALPGELDDADRRREQEEHPCHGEERQQAENEGLRLIAAEKAQTDDGAHQHGGQQQHQPNMARTVRPVDRRASRRVALFSHETQIPSGSTVMPDGALAARWRRSLPRPPCSAPPEFLGLSLP
jgi:hypothetical protein